MKTRNDEDILEIMGPQSQQRAAAAEIPPPAGAMVAITPLAILQQAVTQNLDVEKIGRLMELHERWEAREARKAFTEAMAMFKADPPVITKNKRVHYPSKKEGAGPVDYWHATLDHVAERIIQGLSRCGLSHRWEVEQPDGGQITVTCILTHQLGHSERTTLRAPKDDSAGKNLIQAVGSTVTYLQRYTLLSATGLATGGADDDGEAAGDRGGSKAEKKENAEGLRATAEIDAAVMKQLGHAPTIEDFATGRYSKAVAAVLSDREIESECRRLLREELKTDRSGARYNDAKISATVEPFKSNGELPKLLGQIRTEVSRRSGAQSSPEGGGRQPASAAKPEAAGAAKPSPATSAGASASNRPPANQTKAAQRSGFGF